MTALDESIRAIVRDELRALGITGATAKHADYTRENLPPGFTSGEAFAGECRRLDLDRAIYREGRSWRVPVAVWTEARSVDRARRMGTHASSTTPPIDPIDATLERAGLRLVRVTR